MNLDITRSSELQSSATMVESHNSEERIIKKNIPNADSVGKDERQLLSRSIVKSQEITAIDFKKLVIDGTYKKDVHYVVESSIDFYHSEFKVFPDNVTVKGNLIFNGCNNLTKIGDNLTAEYLSLSNCNNLIKIGNDIHISGVLSVLYCDEITCLGRNISVMGGGGCFYFCHKLIYLVDNGNFNEGVFVCDCSKLTSFGKGVVVKGKVDSYWSPLLSLSVEDLRNMQNIYRETTRIYKEDGDEIIKCENTRSVEITCIDDKYLENISEKEPLIIKGFDILTGLGESLFVGDNLTLLECSKVERMPDWILQLKNKTQSGKTRIIDLGNSNLSFELIEEIRLSFIDVPTSDVHIIFPYRHKFRTFDLALKFWKNLAPSHTEMPDFADFNSDQTESLRIFLEILASTADYKQPETRSFLVGRIINILTVLNSMDNNSKINAMSIIDDGISACGDRASLTLNELEKYPMLMAAETKAYENNDSTDLKELGKNIMLMEIIDKIISSIINALKDQYRLSNSSVSIDANNEIKTIDEVQIRLSMRNRLYSLLGLSGFTQNMLYGGGYDATDEYFELLKDHIMKIQNDDDYKENFFKAWEPLKRYERYQSIPEFNSLKTLEVDHLDECSISCDTSEEMVAIGGMHVSFNALKKSYLEYGKNPFTNTSFEWSDVQRLVRRQVEDKNYSEGPSPSKKAKLNY